MASKAGYMRFLNKKMMADGGFPTIRVEGKGKGEGDIATAAGLGIDEKGKQAAPKRYASGGMAEGRWGEIGGDPGYGQDYHRHNSSGEPHTNEYFSDEHPMQYMAEGGMTYRDQPGEPDPNPGHYQTDPHAGPNPSYSNQHGEPDPDMDHREQGDPDFGHEDAMSEDMANFSEGGMAYHLHDDEEEDEEDQAHPSMDHEDAMDDEMAQFATGGMPQKRGPTMMRAAKGGMAMKGAFAQALRKKAMR